LVGGTSKKQNWKGLSIAFVVIAVICLFIAAAILLTSTRKYFLRYLLLINTKKNKMNVRIGQTTSHRLLIPLEEDDIFTIKIPKPLV
jgi:hypothetical protein